MLPNQKLTETPAEQNQINKPILPEKKWLNFSFSKKNNQPSNIDTSIIIRYIYPLTIIIIIAILVWFFSFLYNNVYLTMTQAEVVSSLKVRVVSERLNTNKFNEIIKKIDDKKLLAGWSKVNLLKSPFTFGVRNNYLNNPISPINVSSTSSTIPIINTSTPIQPKSTSNPATSSKSTSSAKSLPTKK